MRCCGQGLVDSIAHLWHRLPAVQVLLYFVLAYVWANFSPPTVSLYWGLWAGFFVLLLSYLCRYARQRLPVALEQRLFRLGVALSLVALLGIRIVIIDDIAMSSLFGSVGSTIQHYLIKKSSSLSLSTEVKQLTDAIALGYAPRSGEIQEIRQQFMLSGVAHILAVSGFHLGIVVWLLSRLLGFFPLINRHRHTKGAIILLGSWGFTALTGFAIPTIRASLMLSMYIIGRTLGRPISLTNILASVALLQLLISPSLMTNAGFLLSHTAVLSIHLFFPAIYECVGRLKQPVLTTLWAILCVSLSAQVMILPLCLHIFGQISWIFVWTTIPITLAASLLIPLTLVAYLLCLLRLESSLLCDAIEYCAQPMLWLTERGSEVTWLHQELSLPLWAVLFLWAIAIALAIRLKQAPSA